ncbi:UNVERIFIED_CONTAM: hypothetical protein Scaly_2792100 [Sesamum calycinum]|uniref:Uncharacterized protein n=1 Tax=Sesamum calycinum TaxID=2727403 RepID=A0AAW2IWI0_9LAMI
MTTNSGQTIQGGVDAFHMQALVSHLEKLLDRKLEGLHERLDEVENQVTGPRATSQRQGPKPRPQHLIHNEYLEDPSNGEEYENLQPRRVNQSRDRPRRPREEDGGRGGVKVTIPSFKGKSDPEAYLEWKMRVEKIFSCHNYSESKKVKLTALEFTDYALVWWIRCKRSGLGMRTMKQLLLVSCMGSIEISDVVEMHHYVELEEMDYEDVFPEDIPPGLPPIHGIEHQIDVMPGASFSNRPAYHTNLEKIKEIQR